MNFQTLKTSIASYLHRDDLTEVIPTFIEFAEARFNRELRTTEQEDVAYVVPTDEYVSLPSDFLQLRAIYYGGKVIDYRTPMEFQRFVETGDTPPRSIYTITDMSIRIYPAPTAESTDEMRIHYFAKISALSDANPTNWLIEKHPDLYVFASVLEARGFKVDDSRMALWEARVDKTIEQLKRHSAYLLSAPEMRIRVA